MNLISESEYEIYSVDNIHQKVDEVFSNLGDRISIFPGISNLIRCYKDFCKKDLYMPMGKCHGDLTLSNMKVTENNELYIFDFLSCTINSVIQDAAKLIQDFEYGWSFRRESNSLKIKGTIFCNHAYPSFLKILDNLFPYEMRVVEILTILRIAPYINKKDADTVAWFNLTINKCFEKIIG